MKVHQQPAYLLRSRPFAESSLVVDLFTREHGRLSVIAKGARRPKSRVRGVLLPFLPLLASWSGKGQLPTLTSVESRIDAGRAVNGALRGETLASGFYLNELLLLLLHRHDAHEALFEKYHDAVLQLASAPSPRHVLHALRVFEKHFLRHIGFGVALDHDADTGQVIDAQLQYRYIPERGPVRADAPAASMVADDAALDSPSAMAAATATADALPVSGRTLRALRDEAFPSEVELREAQRLTRALIDRQLGGRPLRSRRVLREMSQYNSNTNSSFTNSSFRKAEK